jgi:hypothetical protein
MGIVVEASGFGKYMFSSCSAAALLQEQVVIVSFALIITENTFVILKENSCVVKL